MTGVNFSRLLFGLAVAACAPVTRVDPPSSPGIPGADIPHVPDSSPIFSPLHDLAGDDEVVMGDPKVAGRAFVMRTRELAGTIVPPHTHPFDENLTVVAGTWYFAIGSRFDSTALHALPTGSFVFVPRGQPMFAFSPGPVTVQIHGIGPFEQHFVDSLFTLGDSTSTGGRAGSAPARFRFRVGDQVNTVRGAGRIREGYAVGSIIEYEIVGIDGAVFMAQESEMRKPSGQ